MRKKLFQKLNKRSVIDCIKDHKWSICIVGAVFVLTLIQNFWTHYLSDDWCYMFVYDHMGYPNESSRRVKTIIDVIVSMKNHWKICNGRVVAHGLLQMVLATSYPHFHKVIFNIVNSIIYVALGLLIYKHAAYNKKQMPLLLLGIYAMMWFFLPQYGATVLWASGAANYLWCAVIILAYLLPYRMYAVNSQNVMKDSVKNAVIMGILGLFAGCTNENSGGALALICILFTVVYKICGIKVPKWSFAGILSTILGAIVLVVAPGNYRISSKANLTELLNRLKNVWEISEKLLFPLVLILAAVLFLSFVTNLQKEKKDNIWPPVIYFIGAAASIGAMMFSALRPERTWFIGVCLIISAIGYFTETIDLSALPKYTQHTCALVLTVILAFSMCTEMKEIHVTYEKYNELHKTVLAAVDEGKSEVTVKANVESECKHDIACVDYGIARFQKTSNTWVNAWAAAYYGIDKINGMDANWN